METWVKPPLPPLHFIYRVGEGDILTKIAKPIPVHTIKFLNFQNKLKYLKDCLLKYRKITGLGKGIAAPQVGIGEKFAVIYTPKKLITIINPKITKFSKRKNKYPEGCMSATPIIVPLIRPVFIEFEYWDEFGKKQFWKGRSIRLNRVFQHEIDHLEGIINLDKDNPKEFVLYSNSDYHKKAKFEKVK